jgi:hypothetical protein
MCDSSSTSEACSPLAACLIGALCTLGALWYERGLLSCATVPLLFGVLGGLAVGDAWCRAACWLD